MGSEINIDPAYSALFAQLGLTIETIFTDPRIVVWRSLADRENATLDFESADGRKGRLHIKRYPPSADRMAPREMRGYQLLKAANVPAAPIIAEGRRTDGSSFIILQDLQGFSPADKLVEKGFPFDRLITATADLAALLHGNQLHHRDLYLCHFMVRAERETVEAKLIDMARVDRLRSPLTRRRWIIKDLAQFWYSTLSLPITDSQRGMWLDRYCERRGITPAGLVGPIRRKADAISRHDVRLRQSQPGRNVSVGELPG